LYWFMPALLLQFPLVSMGSALRATGIVQAPTVISVLSVLVNMILAPFLIYGSEPWPILDFVRRVVASFVSLPHLGVTGAAIATFVAILFADVLVFWYFEKKYHYLRFRFSEWRAQFKIWRAMLRIGVPAGAEFVLLFVYILIVYVIIRNFGPAAPARFGRGTRGTQTLFVV